MGSVLARFRYEEFRIVMQGLDAAGKTTILYKLKLGEIVTTIPTIGFNVETLEYKHIKFTAWDIGGRGKMRALWRHYYQGASAIIFVVDSNDTERLDEVKEFIHDILDEDELRGVPLLVFANKQDLPGSITVERLNYLLDFHKLKDRIWHVIPTAATTGDGLTDGLEWLASTLSTRAIPEKTTDNDDTPSTGTILSKSWEVFRSIFVA